MNLVLVVVLVLESKALYYYVTIERFRMTLKNGFSKCSLFVLAANG